MRRMLWKTIAVAAFTPFLASGRADEVKVPLGQLPKAVSEAVKKRFPKAELVEAAKETENGKVEYEVTIKDGDSKSDVMLTPEGTITLIEREITAKQLPKAVAEALEEKYPKATLKTIEEVIKVADGKETLDFYEIHLATVEQKSVEVKISAEGKITGTEKK